ncbi:MAG: hypothetical protein COA58_15530 [Bacteroidetes bacterium]|nr:MAG: hypothetical protein COA58_15530 [Bacteroidota bacterium]
MKKTLNIAKVFLLVLCAIASSTVAFGQTKISGTVTDTETNKPLVGAYVFPVGSKGGAITDPLGKFELDIPSGVSSIKVSFIGYSDQTLELGNQTSFTIKMVSDDRLDEVLVIAYGTQKKSDKTGAVTQVSAKELNRGRLTDPIQAMQGKAAGVNISKQGGDPNKGFSVNIRSSASITGSTDPLYVVDGVVGIDPTTINPDDIESFNILKDAASTSIYGTQGANGVVIITTKGSGIKRSNGSPLTTVEYSSFVSFDKVANRLEFLSADEIRAYATKIGSANFQDGGANTDWLDEIYTTGISQQHTIAVNHSHNSGGFRASLSANNLDGVLKGTTKDRYIGRLNVSQQALNDKLTLNFRLSGTMEKNSYKKYDNGSDPQNIIFQAMRRSPTDPVYNADGTYFESDRSFQYNNPVAMLDLFQDDRDAKRLLGNIKLSYEIVDGLTFSINSAYARNDDQGFKFQPSYAFANTTNGSAERYYNNEEYKYTDEVISYSKVLKEQHSFNIIGGHSWQQTIKNGFTAKAEESFNDSTGANDLQAFSEIKYDDVTSKWPAAVGLASFFTRATYDFDKKYYGTLSIRRDKSSKYGANREWGTFYAVSGAWNLKKEKFLLNTPKISDLRLRLGYGVTGNTNIPEGADQVIYRPSGTGKDPKTGETVVVFNNVNDVKVNPDLGWEQLSEVNIGVDYGFFKNRITGSLEIYRKTTTDLVMEVTLGVPPERERRTYKNLGEIQNNGIELSVNGVIVDRKNLKWNATLVASRNIQKAISLGHGIAPINKLIISGPGLVSEGLYTQRIEAGQPIGSFYLPVYAGVSSDGKFLFETEAGGYTRDWTKAKREYVGTAQPDVILGFSNYFEIWKGFDASFSLRGIFGHKIFNVTRLVFSNPSQAPTLNVLQTALEEEEKGISSTPSESFSDYYLEDGDFIKLDNLSIGYNIPLTKKSKVKNLRFYVNGTNLWMWTKYSGLDPELNFSGSEFGRDQYDVYPRTRSLTAGVNVTF